jgi:hypothetical protein
MRKLSIKIIVNLIGILAFIYSIVFILVFTITVINEKNDYYCQPQQEKPISCPEEIQIAKAGDTLIVSSVSDSIYIGFKHK